MASRALKVRPASNVTHLLARPLFPCPLSAPRYFRAFADPGEDRLRPLRSGPCQAAATNGLAEMEQRLAQTEEEQIAALAAREAATAGELAARGDGAAERHAEMERRLAEREEEHAAALATQEAAAANERTAASQEAEQDRDEAVATERAEVQRRWEAARRLGRTSPRGYILREVRPCEVVPARCIPKTYLERYNLTR